MMGAWIGFTAVALQKGLLQYLDVGAIDEENQVNLFVHEFQQRGREVFQNKGFYRLDIVITGLHDESTVARVSLQLERTDQWDKPIIRILSPNELETI